MTCHLRLATWTINCIISVWLQTFKNNLCIIQFTYFYKQQMFTKLYYTVNYKRACKLCHISHDLTMHKMHYMYMHMYMYCIVYALIYVYRQIRLYLYDTIWKWQNDYFCLSLWINSNGKWQYGLHFTAYIYVLIFINNYATIIQKCSVFLQC